MTPSLYIAVGFITFIVIVAVVISSFNSYKKKIEKKKQLQKFNDFVINNNLTIDSKQRFNKNIIGIDRLNFVVVFLNSKTRKILLVRLKDLSDCRLIKERNKTSGHISRIYLQCIFIKKEKDDVILPFYNEVTDDVYLMMRLSKRAAYWAKRINLFRETARLKNRHLVSA
jgi:hypothetical protein